MLGSSPKRSYCSVALVRPECLNAACSYLNRRYICLCCYFSGDLAGVVLIILIIMVLSKLLFLPTLFFLDELMPAVAPFLPGDGLAPPLPDPAGPPNPPNAENAWEIRWDEEENSEYEQSSKKRDLVSSRVKKMLYEADVDIPEEFIKKGVSDYLSDIMEQEFAVRERTLKKILRLRGPLASLTAETANDSLKKVYAYVCDMYIGEEDDVPGL